MKHKAAYFKKKYLEANHLYRHFETQFAPGHFYSPYPDLTEMERRKAEIFDRSKRPISGIDIRESEQLTLLAELAKHYKKFPYTTKQQGDLRYFNGLNAYSYTDAIILFCMLYKFKPSRVIEIGSGYSSALMLDFKEVFAPKLDLTCIEPYPDLLQSLTKKEDTKNYKLIDEPLYKVDLGVFKNLKSGDFLFIDSTHVSKAGSDVNQIYFDILPKLKKGVIIHIHDIFYPFEYPFDWIKETRAWTEAYLVHAFLYNNNDYEILIFNDFLAIHHKQTIEKLMPLTYERSGGSLWLRKIR